MKYTSIIGVICLAIGLGLFFINKVESELDFLTGLLVGLGAGFLLGGLWGYASKKRKVIEKVVEKPVEIIPEEEEKRPVEDKKQLDLDDDIA